MNKNFKPINPFMSNQFSFVDFVSGTAGGITGVLTGKSKKKLNQRSTSGRYQSKHSVKFKLFLQTSCETHF
jgi:hypothetical protein